MRVIERHQQRLAGQARRITIDLDPTDDATHGAQQLTFFNGHYDSWCYLPLLAFLTFDQEREQYLCAAVLRPGNVPATRGTVGVLCRLLPLLRQAFPQARFLVRLDGGATPEVFDFLMPSRGSTTWWRWPRTPCCSATPSPPCSWRRPRARPAARPRTSTPTPAIGPARGTATGGDQGRGRPARRPRAARQPALRRCADAASSMNGSTAPAGHENRITPTRSCSMACRSTARALSLLGQSTARLLTAAAYVLMQELRLRAARTACARAQVTWLRTGPQIGGARRRLGPPRPAPADPPDLHASRLHSPPDRQAPVSRTHASQRRPSPPVAKPSLDGPVPRPSAPTMFYPAVARRSEPAGVCATTTPSAGATLGLHEMRANTDQEQHYRQPKQKDANEENHSLEVLFVHADRPGPVNPPEESDSEAHQLRRDWNKDQGQNCEREQQHGKHLEGV